MGERIQEVKMNGHRLSARDARLLRFPGPVGAGNEERAGGRGAVMPNRNRPKAAWRVLYVVLAVIVLLFVLAEMESPTGGWRIFTECLGTVLIIGAMALWVRANRVGLALSDETSEIGRPLRAWVAYCSPPTPRRRLHLPQVKSVQRVVFHPKPDGS